MHMHMCVCVFMRFWFYKKPYSSLPFY